MADKKKIIPARLNITNVLIIFVLSLVILQIIGFLLTAFGFENEIRVSKYFILLIISATALIPFMIIKRQISASHPLSRADLVFLILIILVILAFVFVFPEILPEIFAASRTELMSVIFP